MDEKKSVFVKINMIDFFTNTKHFIKSKYFDGFYKKTDVLKLEPFFIRQLCSKFEGIDHEKWICGAKTERGATPMDITYLMYMPIDLNSKSTTDRDRKIFTTLLNKNVSVEEFENVAVCIEKLNTELGIYMIKTLEFIMFPKICENDYTAKDISYVTPPNVTFCPVVDGMKKFVEVDEVATSANKLVKQYDITWTFDRKQFGRIEDETYISAEPMIERVMSLLFRSLSDGKPRHFTDYCDEKMFYSNVRDEFIYGTIENWLTDKFQGIFDNYQYSTNEVPHVVKDVYLWSEKEIYADNKTEKRADQYKIKVSLTVSRNKDDCIERDISI